MLIAIMMFFVLRMADTSVSSLGRTMYRSTLTQAAHSINLQLEYYKRIVDLFVSYNIRMYLTNISNDPSSYYINQTRIKREIINYSNKFMFDNIYVFPRSAAPINAFFDEPVFDPSDQVGKIIDAFINAPPNNDSAFFVSRADPFRIAIYRPIYFNATYMGVVEFDLNMDFFFSVTDKLKDDGFESTLMLDGESRVIYSQSKEQPFDAVYMAPTDPNALSLAIPATGWTMCSNLPQTRINALTAQFMNLFLSMSALLLITFGGFSFLFFRSIQRPLIEIADGMQKVKMGDFSVKLSSAAAPIEYHEIISTFNDMVRRVHSLLSTVYEQQELLRISEVSDLQAKLDPHFLYNSLDMIYWEMIKNEQASTAEMVIALSEILRYSIRHKHEFGTVLEEMHQIENYLKLQSMRLGNGLEWSIELDPRLNDLSIPCLLLQPLVENCIRHAFTGEQTYKYIGVTGTLEDDKIKLIVVDNGVGIAPEKVATLLTDRSEQKQNGVGLALVNRRIQLIYGSEFGMTIDSKPKHGCMITTVLLTCLPEREVL